jgi:hypothetical protein
VASKIRDKGNPVDKDPAKGRLSREAWIAAGATIGAALLGGVVALWTHLTPAAQNPSPSAPTRSSTAVGSSGTAVSSAPDTAATTIQAMVGKWSGTARDSNGTAFRITLEVSVTCAPSHLCGTIGVSHVPCHGQIFLENVDNGDVEFRVDNFDDGSNRQLCQPGAGEHFQLQSDGRLAYHTSYDPAARGTLSKQ